VTPSNALRHLTRDERLRALDPWMEEILAALGSRKPARGARPAVLAPLEGSVAWPARPSCGAGPRGFRPISHGVGRSTLDILVVAPGTSVSEIAARSDALGPPLWHRLKHAQPLEHFPHLGS